MQKHIVNEKTGISYTLQGDYYIPDLTVPPETDDRPIGIWGSRHKQYLKENKSALISEWLISCFYKLLHRKTKSTFSE